MKNYRVATFYSPAKGHARSKPKVSCYTLWYNPQWPGCIEYSIEAVSGAEAKKKAAVLRKAHESRSN